MDDEYSKTEIKEEDKQETKTEDNKIEDISADFENTLKENAKKEEKKEDLKLEDIAHDELKEDFEDMQNDTNYLPIVIGGGVVLLGGIFALLYFGKDNIDTNTTVETRGADSWTN